MEAVAPFWNKLASRISTGRITIPEGLYNQAQEEFSVRDSRKKASGKP
jgi:hypothetical protein